MLRTTNGTTTARPSALHRRQMTARVGPLLPPGRQPEQTSTNPERQGTNELPKTKPTAQPRKPAHTRDRYTDDDFWDEIPDEQAAYAWLAAKFWPTGPRCPTCCRCRPSLIPAAPRPIYRCVHCKENFSVVTATLMDGLDIPLHEWLQAIFIFTGGPTISSPRTLAERIGWDEETAREITYRLLQATAEPAVRLREPSEMDWTQLQYSPKPGIVCRVWAIGLVGRRMGKVAGLEMITNEDKWSIENFVHRYLADDMPLICDSHASNRNVPWEIKRYVQHNKGRFAHGPACTNLPEGLWKRVKRVLHTDYSWGLDGSLSLWLDGLRWRENHRGLTHRKRMAALATGMRWKKPVSRRDEYPYMQVSVELPIVLNQRTPCANCRNSLCLSDRKRSFWLPTIPRADRYRARKIA